MIARCASAADVAAALNLDHRLELAVRGGGHSIAGWSVNDDGVVIDLSPMRDIQVDPLTKTARAGAGVLWGELDAATQAHGLATRRRHRHPHRHRRPHARRRDRLADAPQHGATVDNLRRGRRRHRRGRAAAREPAPRTRTCSGRLRGGGGNFGIVTSFEYRLHEVGPTILGGPLYFALEDGPRCCASTATSSTGPPTS